MNKDLDERLVPNGQYRDANNIEVSTSEDNDVGSVQSIKGNTSIADVGITSTFNNGVCIGAFSDEKNNCAYWLVTTDLTWSNGSPLAATPKETFRDVIYKTTHSSSSTSIEPVFVDFWLEKHLNPTASSSSSDAWVGGPPYTGITLTSASNLSAGMWIKFSTATGGFVRKIASISSNTVTFDDSIDVISSVNHLEFTWTTPEVYGNYAYTTNQFKNRILRFDKNYLITGINVIDDLLMFTDGNSEPKKVNIARAKLGTTSINITSKIRSWDETTSEYVYTKYYKEQDVTVIKQAPKTAPILELVQGVRLNDSNSFDFNFNFINENDLINFDFTNQPHSYIPNDILIIVDSSLGIPTQISFDVELRVVSATQTGVEAIVTKITNQHNTNKNFNTQLVDDNKPLFDDKLVRFATRYKYVDGEYSTFSPFSVPAFLPGDFSYSTKEALNVGMRNTLKEVVIKDYIPIDISGEVEQVEILYKESDSPTIYFVDNIKPSDVVLDNENHPWTKVNDSLLFTGSYKILSEKLYSTIESNQLLRPWDAVPRTAKAQEIIGNRLVYGNYLQNYNIDTKPLFEAHLQERTFTSTEMLLNPNADPINLTNGTKAEGWTNENSWALIDYYQFWYLGGGFEPVSTGLTQFSKLYQNLIFEDSETYRVRIKVKGMTQGKLGVNLISPSKYAQFFITQDGEYERNVTLLNSHTNSINISINDMFNGNKTFNMQSVDVISFDGQVSDFSVKKVFTSNKASIKSQRTYQLGVVYSDAYGRQTPVLTSSSASFKVPKFESQNNNSIFVSLQNIPPPFADGFKYYIKETSSPYHNLAVGRVYRAKDQNVWVSFPSSERNKIDEKSYLELKKGFETGAVLEENASYKVIAIESEAPEFIKTQRNTITIISQSDTSAANLGIDYFGVLGKRPVDGAIVLAIKKSTLDNEGNAPDLTNQSGLFSLKFLAPSLQSLWYDFESVSIQEFNGDDYYVINLDDPITNGDSSWILTTGNAFNSGVEMRIARKKIENKPEFEGVFFVKILLDSFIEQNILSALTFDNDAWGIVAAEEVYYLSDSNKGSIGGTNDVALAITNDVRTKGDATSISFLNEFDTSSPYADESGISSYSPSFGVPYASGSDWKFRGSRDAYEKWTRILKLELQSGSYAIDDGNEETGRAFFIDKSSYIGVQSDGDNDPRNGSYYSQQTIGGSSSSSSFEGNFFSHAPAPTGKRGNILPNRIGFGRGIWQVGADGETYFDGTSDPFFTPGEYYMEISYGKLSANSTNNNLTASEVNNPANWVDAWAVGSNSNDLNTSNEIAEFVERLTSGSYFRFANDSAGTVYRIEDSRIEKRYNHTAYPFSNNIIALTEEDFDQSGPRVITWGSLPYTVQGNVGAENNINFYYDGGDRAGVIKYDPDAVETGDVILDTLGTEKTLFGKATNRRLTYQLKISRMPGLNNYSPINTAPSSGATTPATSSHNVNQLLEFLEDTSEDASQLLTNNPAIFETKAKNTEGLDVYYEASNYYSIGNHHMQHELPWFNCYSFNNGVESNRIKDDFNEVFLDNQAIVSTTLLNYKENNRKFGLIFSGIFNSTSGVNSLNQFIAAENITKDINPTYGSVQKLHARNSNLLVFCEDKVLKILSDKDALFNANGNINVVASDRFLGQTMPFSGNYGISENPESFASDDYRVYFTDKQKGAVLRLSMDGITPISDYGMRDWFKDNLAVSTGVLGSFDANKKEYNVTIKDTAVAANNYTVSYNEYAKGWSSFKSFIPQEALSVENNYFSFATVYNNTSSKIWKHHTNSSYNNFYGETATSSNNAFSSVSFILNESPSIIKTFKTLNYEGTQAKVEVNTNATEGEYYNLSAIAGWNSTSITTDKQSGLINEFLEKEGKWFNFIKGDTTYYTSATDNNVDFGEFTVQGLGVISSHTTN